MNTDLKIYDFIENKMMVTTGEEQKEWVTKYDIFTCRTLFEKDKKNSKLAEVEKIRREVLNYIH